MNYKITQQYLKTKEVLIAAFFDLNDAKLFVTQKCAEDEVNRIQVGYRIYSDYDLVQEFSNESQVLSEREDAETYGNAQFIFNVQRQGRNSLQRKIVAYFNEEKDAFLFVVGKCYTENPVDMQTSFLIFKDQLLISTLNKTIIDNKALKEQDGRNKGGGASLSPLATRPTPPGGPGDYWIEKYEDRE